MRVVLVDVRVRQGFASDFIEATKRNAAASRMEPGILRFDLLRAPGEVDHFLLVEIFRDLEAPLAHKATPHYQAWQKTVEPLMAEPRKSTQWDVVDPANPEGW